MAKSALEQRVASLEKQVDELQAELRTIKTGEPRGWQRSIGAFTDDDGVKEILRDALELRADDRRRARAKKTKQK